MNWFTTVLFFLLCCVSNAQTVTGYVADIDTQRPLKGVIVLVDELNISTESDSTGFWRLNVPAGIYSVSFKLLGYELIKLSEVLILTGKQRILTVDMKESVTVLDEVTIMPDSRSSSKISRLEIKPSELLHIPGNANDPVRMLASMPGISNTGDDRNDLIVRGNTSVGVLWRIEGIEVFNPNHYSFSGSGGGAISLLNKDILGNSYFYTGAFPVEYGNVFSGVFDATFREGNVNKYEFSADVNNMDASVLVEGPISTGKNKSSFVAALRQSTIPVLDIINKKYRELLGATPVFSDFSFKLTSKNKLGAKTVFWGMGGKSDVDLPANTGSNTGSLSIKNHTENVSSGLSHQLFIGKKASLKAVLGVSFLKIDNGLYASSYENKFVDKSKSIGAGIVSDVKLNRKNILKEGINIRFMDLNINKSFIDYSRQTKSGIQKKISTINAFTEWTHNFNSKLTATSGIHYFMFSLNKHYRIEPRLSLVYLANKYNFEIALGEYSRQNPIPLYMSEVTIDGQRLFPNQNLDFIKSRQAVFSFGGELFRNIKFKTELYYQYHYDVAIAKQSTSGIDDNENMFLFSSALDMSYYSEDIDLRSTVYDNQGKGYSKGIEGMIYCDDIHGFSMNVSGSLLKSIYHSRKGWFNTLFNNSFTLKAFVGKRFKLSDKAVLRMDIAANWFGGRRYTPIDCDMSYFNYFYDNSSYSIVYDYSKYHEKRYPDYFRIDFKTSLMVNLKSSTHIFSIDIRNLTDHENIYYHRYYFENNHLNVYSINQLQRIPVLSYKLLFRVKS